MTDIPLHLQEPHSCRLCHYGAMYKPGSDVSRLMCLRHPHGPSCTFERHETGECGPDAQYWKVKR